MKEPSLWLRPFLPGALQLDGRQPLAVFESMLLPSDGGNNEMGIALAHRLLGFEARDRWFGPQAGHSSDPSRRPLWRRMVQKARHDALLRLCGGTAGQNACRIVAWVRRIVELCRLILLKSLEDEHGTV